MTLIAGMRCADGIVVCADSQETVRIGRDSYRVAVQKIQPRDLGNFEVAIGGSGIGDLIDAFIAVVEPIIKTSNSTTLAQLQKLIHDELFNFIKTDVQLYPRSSREMKFIICARSKTDSEIELWRTAASRVVPIPTCWLIGWEQPLYQHVLDQHYTSSISVNRAILLGASLFELAESTSNY